jgi:hypothetical protein
LLLLPKTRYSSAASTGIGSAGAKVFQASAKS